MKTALNKMKKKMLILGCMVFSLILGAVPALATEPTANESVVTAFTELKGDVIATLGAVAAVAVGVMAIFLAWKYGRKIFSQIAK